MKRPISEEIATIVKLHSAWLNGEPDGKRADLHGRDLAGVDLSRVDLRCAELYEATLASADLHGALLCDADLFGADLRRANLKDADLYEADLRLADLSGADLRGADLRDAVLCEANLSSARLDAARYDSTTIGIHPAPEGTLIGWDKVDGLLVKLRIPASARRSCATSRLFRAEYAKVVWIEGGGSVATPDGPYAVTYEVGKTVRCHSWCNDRWQENGGGLRFFLTRKEAEEW